MADELKLLNQAVADCVSGIVSAYVAKNHVPRSDLPALIASVRASVGTLATGGQQVPALTDLTETDARIRKSITPDALISFIDGKRYKTLKRHLRAHGMNAGTYCRKFGLPHDYPMVCPTYSTRRSEISRNTAFGRYERRRTSFTTSGRN